jgi:hypothetical protein
MWHLNMKAIGAVEASYAEHVDGKCHCGSTVGFETDMSSCLAYVSSKQPAVEKSTGEAALITQNRVGD